MTERPPRTQVWLSEADTALCDDIRMTVGRLEGCPTPPRTEVVREALTRYREALRRAEAAAEGHAERAAAWRPPTGKEGH